MNFFTFNHLWMEKFKKIKMKSIWIRKIKYSNLKCFLSKIKSSTKILKN